MSAVDAYSAAAAARTTVHPSEAEMTLDDFLKRKMPYAPAIAIGTFMSFFAR